MIKLNKEIPLLYQIIIRRLLDRSSTEGIIETGKARFILNYHCRIPKTLTTAVMNEMYSDGLIDFNNHKFIQIIAKVDIVLDNRFCKF